MRARKTTEQYIQEIRSIYGDIFEFGNTIYKGCHELVTITCPIHGDFDRIATNFLMGGGCSLCNSKYTTETLIQKLVNVRGDEFDYSKVKWNGSDEKITIICKVHGEFDQSIYHHLSGFGCSECSGNRKKTSIDFKTNGFNLYGEKNDYSKIQDFKNNKTPVEIICKYHGSFFKSYYDHIIKNFDCPDCNNIVNTTSKFIIESVKTHGNLYGYFPSTYMDNKTTIEITCRTHGSFWQNPSDHMNGAGCSKCNISRGERAIMQWLITNNLLYEYNKSFDNCRNPVTNRKLWFDFYLPTPNTLIEFDGRQHFAEVSCKTFKRESLSVIQYRDNLKNEYAKNNNIKLLRIPYIELKNINQILEKELNLCPTK